MSQDQLAKLRKLSAKQTGTSNKNNHREEKKGNDAVPITGASVSAHVVRESPVRHRLSNLLDGSAHSADYDAILPNDGDSHVTIINGEEETESACELLSNPESVKARLFDPVELPSVDDASLPLTQDEDCITVPCYPDVVAKTCLQVNGALRWGFPDDTNLASAQDEKNSSSEVTEHHEEVQSCNDAADDGESFRSSGTFLPVNEEVGPGSVESEAKLEGELAGDSGCGSMSSIAEDNPIDYANGYNTLEVC